MRLCRRERAPGRTSAFLAGSIALAVSACGGGGPPQASADQDSLSREGVYGTAPAAANGVRSVVTLTAVSGPGASEPGVRGPGASGASDPSGASRGEPLIDQFGLSFSPQRLVVTSGTTLTISNSEASLSHNVHVRSVTDGTTLINDDTLPGDVLELSLMSAGGYDVLCDMHPGMTAFVYVTDTPWTTFADADGAFDLGIVPPGDYVMRLWTVGDGYGPAVPIAVDGPATQVDMQPER